MEIGGVLFQTACYVLLFAASVVVMAKSGSRTLGQAILLASSVALYLTWQIWFAAVLFISIVANFLFGKWLRTRQHWLPLSIGIVFNLALLSAFKYFLQVTLHVLPASLPEVGRLALPQGTSFWTFQAMSYLFDLYRGEELDPTFVEFAL